MWRSSSNLSWFDSPFLFINTKHGLSVFIQQRLLRVPSRDEVRELVFLDRETVSKTKE